MGPLAREANRDVQKTVNTRSSESTLNSLPQLWSASARQEDVNGHPLTRRWRLLEAHHSTFDRDAARFNKRKTET